MASRSKLHLQHPTPARDTVCRGVDLVILVGLAYQLFSFATGYHQWWKEGLAWTALVVLAVLGIPRPVMYASSWWQEWRDWRDPGDSRTPIVCVRRANTASRVVHLFFAGVGPHADQLFGSTTLGGEIDPDSYAGPLVGDHLISVAYARCHDERVLFRLIYDRLRELYLSLPPTDEPLRAKVQALSGGAGVGLRCKHYCLEQGLNASIEIEAPVYTCPVLAWWQLRPLQMVQSAYFRLCSGGPPIEWAWSHGLQSFLWAENPENVEYAGKHNRARTVELVRRGDKSVSAGMVLGLTRTLFSRLVFRTIFGSVPGETTNGQVTLFIHPPKDSQHARRDRIVSDWLAWRILIRHYGRTHKGDSPISSVAKILVVFIGFLGHGALTEGGDGYRKLVEDNVV